MKTLISNPLANLHLSATNNVGPFNDYFNTSGAEAATWPDGDGTNVYVVFNPENCAGIRSTQNIIAELIHESIHARMLNDCWPEDISYSSYKL